MADLEGCLTYVNSSFLDHGAMMIKMRFLNETVQIYNIFIITSN